MALFATKDFLRELWNAGFRKTMIPEMSRQALLVLSHHEVPRTRTCLNTLRPKQNGRHFANGLFQMQFYLDNDLVPNKRQAIIWTNAGPIHWRTYAALGGDELTYISPVS